MDEKALSKYLRPVPGAPLREVGDVSLGYESEQSFGESQLREYTRILIKYRTIILSTIGVCLLFALIFVFTATPQYTAQSTIRIGTYEPVLAATRVEDLLLEKSKQADYLDTQVQEIKSFSVADRVFDDPRIREEVFNRNKPGFFGRLFGEQEPVAEKEPADSISGYKTPIKYLKSYLRAVEIKPIRRTSLVQIQSTSTNAEFSAKMANTHALSYIDWVRSTRVAQQSQGLKFLTTQAEELKQKVADLEREIADYAEANSIIAVNKDENITAQRMSHLNKLLTEATAKRIEAENNYKEADRALKETSAGFDDSSTQGLRGDLSKLEAEYAQLSQKFTPSYPKMKQLASQIEGTKKAIKGQRGQIVTGLKTKYLATLEEENNLKEELEQQKSQTFELSKSQVQYNILNRELESSRELLQNILKQIKETSLSVESNASNVSVVDYAVVPDSPSFPRKRLILFVALVVGSSLGLGVAFLLHYLDNTIRTPEDVSHVLQLPSLGVVPCFELEQLNTHGQPIEALPESTLSPLGAGEARNGGPAGPSGGDLARLDGRVEQTSAVATRGGSFDRSLPIIFVNNPRSLAAEAYRTIRTAVLLSQAGEPPRTILVTSAQSSEGKTTSTINLGASLASAGGRVIIIDADLRRPSVSKYFNLPSSLPGLVEVITGQKFIEEVTIKDVFKRLAIVPPGAIPPNPAELLSSLEMVTIIDKLSRDYDYVLIDSPPILPVTDSVILSRYVDGVVMVVKGGATPRRVIKDAKNRLAAVGAKLLGVMLNDVDVTGGDYYYYNRYYYSYYQDGQGEQAM